MRHGVKGALSLLAVLVAAALIAVVTPGLTQSPQAPPEHQVPRAQPGPSQKASALASAPVAAPETPAVSLEQARYLIRSAMMTLNDANHSGNYTVLRDLAAPSFQARNGAADLAIIFTDLRKRNFDLAAAAVMTPVLSRPPQIDNDRVLRLTGVFPTRPLQIGFELMFESDKARWRLLGISVTTPPATPATAKNQK